MTYGSTYRILLVDDDPNCLDAIDQILRREGYETFAISEGRAIAGIIANNDINLAIVDFDLADTDGLQVLYEIKRLRRNLPVVLITAEPSKDRRLASLEAGAYNFISKPINIPGFRRIVAKALEFSRLRTMTVRRELVFTRWIRWITHK